MNGIVLVLANTPKAIARRLQMTRLGIEQAFKANKIKKSFVVRPYEVPEWISCNENYRATNN